MNLEFFRQMHQDEFARLDRLSQRASTIIGILTTLAGLLALIAINYRTVESAADLAFWLPASAAAAAFFVSAYYLVKSYLVPSLQQLSKPSEWREYHASLSEDYAKGEGKHQSADAEFTEYVIDQYCEIADKNIASNYHRGVRLVYANGAALIMFGSLTLASVVLYHNNHMLRKSADVALGEFRLSTKSAFQCLPIDVKPAQSGSKAAPS
jgi:hypothetical protein